MQCFVDTWAVILDDNNKPLVGKIGFYEPSTTTLKNIYGTDEVIPLPNPIYCNGVTTNQVLLDEGDYTARYWRYIGNGNMESDQNEDSWLLYKTELIKDGSVVKTDFIGNGVVDTVDELKDLTGMEDGDICLVHGYYTNDDCPARYFVWHENGQYDDDGGVVLKSNSQNTGAWIMKIPGSYIDVRWFGDIPSNAWNGTSSNLGQRAKAASAANKYSKDLYFPSFKGGTQNGFYVFNGSNTVSVNQNIICDSGVRFVVKHGTNGTVISCAEFIKEGRYLFVSEVGQTIGGYQLNADWIKSSWLNGNTVTVLDWARQGFIIDEMQAPVTFENTKLRVENSPMAGTTWKNCEVLECNKLITNNITIQDMEIDTDWFADNYNWSNLFITGCSILLNNCKDANTYIILKNKQLESNYGDLGEQNINASVLAGGTIENCYGTITLSTHGAFELHNVSLTINGSNSNDSFNAVDSWLTFGSSTVVNDIQLRRGSVAGQGVQVLNDSLFDNVDLSCDLNCLGTDTTIRNSSVYGYVRGTNLKLINNQVYNEINQQDDSGLITIYCTGNMFHLTSSNLPARHYVHATVADTTVKGIWANNGSSYDTVHWIRLDRTNLKGQDNDHQYSYMNNSEPYLQKYSGLNHPMHFPVYAGTKDAGRGIFATTTIPFVFFNKNTLRVSIVNRNVKWKAFSVGRGFLARSGHIQCDWYQGIFESDYAEHTMGDITIVYTWGKKAYKNSLLLDNQTFGYAQMSSLDDIGEANYDVSFEHIDQDHTISQYSNGVEIGVLTRSPYDGWGRSEFAVYPAAPNSFLNLFVVMDSNFVAGVTTPENFT